MSQHMLELEATVLNCFGIQRSCPSDGPIETALRLTAAGCASHLTKILKRSAPSSWGFRFLPPFCFCPLAAGAAGGAAAAAALTLRLLAGLAAALPCC